MSFQQNIRYAIRLMGKKPLFTAAIILTLAVCVGAVTAVFSIVDATLLRPEFVWGALDCPGGFAAGYPETTLLLGRLAARIHRLPEAGERCVAMGWQLGVDGRKRFAGTALVSGGEILARARATWIVPRT